MLNNVIGVASHKLHVEEAELVVNVVQFMYDGANSLVFLRAVQLTMIGQNDLAHINDHLTNDSLVRKVTILKIKVCWNLE